MRLWLAEEMTTPLFVQPNESASLTTSFGDGSLRPKASTESPEFVVVLTYIPNSNNASERVSSSRNGTESNFQPPLECAFWIQKSAIRGVCLASQFLRSGMPGHRVDDDMSEENIENQYDEVAGSSTSSQETSTLENSNLSTTGSMQRWFPHDDCFKVDEKTLTSSEVISTLSPFLADERKQRIKEVIANRTYSVCIAVEGLLELGNISAVFRSADALGFQSVHVISNESNKKYKKNRKVSRGTEKWLDAEMWENSSDCIVTLRKRGYRIAVTHIAPDTVSIHDMDWTIPTAVFLGTECKGASEEAIEQSDIRCYIPMVGMVESFNVSVAAGILMYHAARDRITRSGTHGDISPQDRKVLEAEFYSRHTGNHHTIPILERLLKKKSRAPDGPSMQIFSDDFLASIEDAKEPEEPEEPEDVQM